MDDCLVNRQIMSPDEHIILQEDLDIMTEIFFQCQSQNVCGYFP